MERYKITIHGTKPLLMHSPEGMISDRSKLRRGEHPDPKVEAENALYKDADGKICVPNRVIKACIRNAGRNYKISGRAKSTYGAAINAGIEVIPLAVPLIYDKDWVVDQRSVVVQRQRIIRARPRFDLWSLEFQIINKDPNLINANVLKRIITDAGHYYGIGDYRPEFGLFELEEFKSD